MIQIINPSPAPIDTEQLSSWSKHKVMRRNGETSSFDPSKIAVAMAKAFKAINGISNDSTQSVKEIINTLTFQVCSAVTRRNAPGTPISIEDIQDQVELSLMRSGEHKVARAYVLYREQHAQERNLKNLEQLHESQDEINITVHMKDGTEKPLDITRVKHIISEACADLSDVEPQKIIDETLRNLYNGMREDEVSLAMIMSARTLIETDPNYSFVAARLLLDNIRHETLSYLYEELVYIDQSTMDVHYVQSFPKYIQKAVALELLDPRLAEDFDLEVLGKALLPERDFQFTYLGLQTLYDRYFIHSKDTRIELPQAFFMRVSMGLAINEEQKTAKAIEFYRLLSSFDFMSSTPTLFNSGTLKPQLSSCYLTTIGDDLDGIYEGIKENALLSKFAGGLGNDWTAVRAMGSRIKGTNGKSQGVVPFLKVANDTAVAVNQGGKRKGAVCAYLETWHLDIEEFLDLRKNTGDDRRRTHDMNTANWIPDLFMQRVMNNKSWTLFSPSDAPDLHDLYGKEFEARYCQYEAMAERNEISHKTVIAEDLWRRILMMLFETGHPWITFKDPCNIRSPQQHAGVVHSSNLCTEITLNTNAEEIAVCNLGSINLTQHITEDGKIDHAKLERTINTAMRMLDNVIEYNYYSVKKAEVSNLRHRPVGMGIMGFHDTLYKLRIPYNSEEAVDFSDSSMEAVSYFAIKASSNLAEERGVYSSYEGSLWSKGVLPIDSIEMLRQARNGMLKQDNSQTMDWNALRERVKTVGMRNSNTMAIAPTATIANICGVSPSIDPTYKNLYVKSNLSGDFTIINPMMVNDLKKEGLWDDSMVNDLKFYDGEISKIDRVPEYLKNIYATAFEIKPSWLIECGSRRQKWIDQAQSLNIYIAGVDGKKLNETYQLAWVKGLKTTYYLRSMGATSIEKSTLENDGKLNGVTLDNAPKVCSILDPDCEACQ